MALYGCSGGGGSNRPAVTYQLYTLVKSNEDLWGDDGRTWTFTLTAPKEVIFTVTVTSDHSHAEAITVDGASFTNGGTIAAGTHTVIVTITGYHYGVTKTGTLSITGTSKALPTLTLVSISS